MEIIDDFLPKQNFDRLVKDCYSLPFSIVDGVSGETSGTDKHDWQLTHWFYHLPRFYDRPFEINNESFPLISEIMKKINILVLYRAKLNINYNTEEIYEHGYHIDIAAQNSTYFENAIYYLNTNDGYTIFEDGTIIESVANRIVKFPSDIRHTGSSCTNAKYRMVLNLLYIPPTT